VRTKTIIKNILGGIGLVSTRERSNTNSELTLRCSCVCMQVRAVLDASGGAIIKALPVVSVHAIVNCHETHKQMISIHKCISIHERFSPRHSVCPYILVNTLMHCHCHKAINRFAHSKLYAVLKVLKPLSVWRRQFYIIFIG